VTAAGHPIPPGMAFASASLDAVVSIGSFDGVHRGHQRLLRDAVDHAHRRGWRATAVTFEPLPAQVLRPDRFLGRICTADDKQRLIRDSEVDDVKVLRFTSTFAKQSPDSFMETLVRRISVRELWVGEGFALGKDRLGDVAYLQEIGRRLGFDVVAIPRLTTDESVISSSAIRRAVVAGDVSEAARSLGRPFRVTGTVIHGAHLGRTIGFPTANVPPPLDLVPLADGIYATWATIEGEQSRRHAMTYVGTRPTVNTGQRLVETHLLDYDGDLYGRCLTVDMIERLRSDESFSSLEAMVEQLHRDEQAARRVLRPGGS
jgi:riboflavin kinase/FMN adenylyltransferase